MADRYLLEDGSGFYLLEDGSGYYLLEQDASVSPPLAVAKTVALMPLLHF